MRKLMRSMARANMKRQGLRRVNSKRAGQSYFAKHWREYV